MIYGALGLTVLAFGAGWTVRDWRCDAAQTAALEQAGKNEDKAEEVVADEAEGYEGDRAQIATQAARERVIVQEIYRDVEVPSDCAVGPAAVGVLDRARERANAATAGELGAAVPDDPTAAEPAG
jgi:hypothetical protein